MGGIRSSCRFAAIADIAVAIAETGRAGDAAHTRGTAGCAMIRTACGTASAAVGNAVGDVGFTTVGDIAVAVLEGAGARSHLADPGDTGAYRVGRGAFVSAGGAVIDVGVHVGFTTVRGASVAVRPTGVARADTAHAERALCGGVGNAAFDAAAATVAGVVILVRFAAVGAVLVAVAIRSRAVADAADPRCANRRAVGPVRTYRGAVAAVVHALVQVSFTTVGNVGVTVGEIRVAADGAAPRVASCGAVGGVAGFAAAATMGRASLQVRLAAIRGVTVAVCPIGLTTRNRAGPVGTGRRRIGQAANRRASAAVVGVVTHRRVAPVAGVAVAISESAGAGGIAVAGGASGGSMVVGTRNGAGATMVGRLGQVCLATVVRVLVAIAPPRIAAHQALTSVAGRCPIGRTAPVAAPTTIQRVAISIGLATVCYTNVAVGIPCAAIRIAADTVLAHQWRFTCVAANAAVGVIGKQVNFAAVAVLAIAVAVTLFTRIDSTCCVETLHVGIGLVATGAAGIAVALVQSKIDTALRATCPIRRTVRRVVAATNAVP